VSESAYDSLDVSLGQHLTVIFFKVGGEIFVALSINDTSNGKNGDYKG
jgi:hypothetical protein